MKTKKVTLPADSVLSDYKYDYADSYQGTPAHGVHLDPITAGKAFFSSSPGWIDSLFSLRNKLAALFGLKTGGETKNRRQLLAEFQGKVGERLGLFEVFDATDSEMILGEDDKHLNFRVSIYIDATSDSKKTLTISTVVVFHNWFGRLYFLPVKPFHKFIVKAMLKSMITIIEARSGNNSIS